MKIYGQPVVTASANGGARAEVTVGETVTFGGVATRPPGAGTIVGAEWDLTGRGHWEHRHTEVDGSSARVELRTWSGVRVVIT